MSRGRMTRRRLEDPSLHGCSSFARLRAGNQEELCQGGPKGDVQEQVAGTVGVVSSWAEECPSSPGLVIVSHPNTRDRMCGVEPLPVSHAWLAGWWGLVGRTTIMRVMAWVGEGIQAHQPLATADCIFWGCPQRERAEEAIGQQVGGGP